MVASSSVVVNDAVRDAIIESDIGPRILYELASDDELAEKLTSLSTAGALKLIGKLEAQFEKTEEPAKAEKLKAKIERYESDPATGEGKKELMAKARALEAERDAIKKTSPWLTFAGSAFQIAIVLLSASILAVAPALYTASIVVGALAALLMSQGLWLWLPITL